MAARGKLTVALLSGGKSAEREVSIKSGDQVYQALDKSKYEIIRYDPRDDLLQLARDAGKIDVALIILHGRLGEDGTIQGYLESLEIPHHGSGVLGSALAINKIVSKILYQQAGLPVAAWEVIDQRDPGNLGETAARLGLPLVIKPEHEGSSIGMSIVADLEQFKAALPLAWRYDKRCLVEQFLAGTEITCGVLGNDSLEALPVIEIVPGEEHAFFDYEAKYIPGRTREICPARISDALTRKAQQYALRAHQVLHCRGYSRTDMIIVDDEIYLLETNTIPGMTETSLFPQAAAAAGYSFTKLLDRLIELALEE